MAWATLLNLMHRLALGFLLFSGLAPGALAAGGQARLIIDGERVGVMIIPEPGWKTYWRLPGETGVAPRFNWNGSGNLRRAEVLYPAPRRYVDPEGETIGFAQPVVFPVELEKIDAALPVRLELQLDFGLCKEICIPASVRFSAKTGASDAAAGALIDAALAKVPEKKGQARLEAADGGILAQIRLPNDLPIEDVLVEGLPLAYFRQPRAMGIEKILIPMDGNHGLSVLRGAEVVLTVIAGQKAFEIPARVD